MSDIAIAEQARPLRIPAPDAPKRTKRVGKKLFHAIELIVFEGKPMDEAAAGAGLTTYTLRQAFARPQVLAHLRERREVLRAAACGKNILRLTEIRDAADNMPAVNAIKVLEQIGDEQTNNRSTSASPGVTIRIVNVAPAQPVIDADILRQNILTNEINDLQGNGSNGP